MRIPRCRLCCVIFEDKIFAMGGRDNVTSYVTVEMFDLKTNTWDAPKDHMNYPREDFCAIVYHSLGLKIDDTIRDLSNRPVHLVPAGQVPREMI